MVIQQLALEWGSRRDVAKMLALRAGGAWETWEVKMRAWRRMGFMSERDADRLACVTGHHIEELWAS